MMPRNWIVNRYIVCLFYTTRLNEFLIDFPSLKISSKKLLIKIKKLLSTFIALSISTCFLYSQNKTVKGRVIAEDFETMPGVSIRINDTVEVGKTDMDGFFQIDVPYLPKEILFMFPGMEVTTIEPVDQCDKNEVVMMYSNSYDFITLTRAERKRKKRFKKLPEIHKQAFDKGIFETEHACYNREFEALYINEN